MNAIPLVKEQVTLHLREHILKLRSDTPVRIDSERALTQDLGVSRVSIRSAIKTLSNEGLLTQIKGSGTYITPNISFDSISLAISRDIKYNDPFYMNLISETNAMCARLSIKLNLVNFNTAINLNVNSPIIDNSIIVCIGQVEDNIMNILVNKYKKVISLFDNSDNSNTTQISYDDYNIGSRAAEILHQYGHKRTLLLAGPAKYTSSHYRRLGFITAVDRLGLNNQIIYNKMNWSGGNECAKKFLELYAIQDNRPTGVFAANDWMAIGFIQGLKEARIIVPDEISVIGCDDVPLASEYQPLLSTFNLDANLIVDELCSILNNKEPTSLTTNRKVLLFSKFINRKTLKSIKINGIIP